MVNVAPVLYRANILIKFIKTTCPWIDWPRLEANVSRQGRAVMAGLPLRLRLCLQCACACVCVCVCVWRACFFVFMAHHLLNFFNRRRTRIINNMFVPCFAAKILRNTLFVAYMFVVFYCKSSLWKLFCIFVFWCFSFYLLVMQDSKVNVCTSFQVTTHKAFRLVCKPFCCLAKHPSTAHRIFFGRCPYKPAQKSIVVSHTTRLSQTNCSLKSLQ